MSNPQALNELKSVTIDDDIKSFVSQISKDVETADGDRSEWLCNDNEYYRQRYGIRNQKNFPWKNSANYSIPLIDTNLEDAKPPFINLYTKSNPVVTFTAFLAENCERARKREQLFDWRLRNRMDFFTPYCYGIDKLLQSGYVVFKTVWNYKERTYTEYIEIEDMDDETKAALYDEEALNKIALELTKVSGILKTSNDVLFQIIVETYGIDVELEKNVESVLKAIEQFRQGETSIEVTIYEKEHDEPLVIACTAKDVVVPSDTTDIQNARFIDYPYWTTKNDIKIAMKDNTFQEYDDDEIDGWITETSNKPSDTERKGDVHVKEGVNTSQNLSDLILMHETCVWRDVNGDGIEEKCITTWPDKDPTNVLRFIELPYDHGRWPYEQIKLELTDESYFSSRGLPAKDLDFQVGLSGQFNAMVDNNTIINSPMLVTVKGQVTNARNIRYVPGQHVEVKQANSFELKQTPNINQGSFMETMRMMKSWSQERHKNMSFSYTDTLNQQGKRSATEADQIGAMFDLRVGMVLQIFQHQMKKVYHQIDSLWYQFGPEEEEMLITGEEPQKVTRKEIQGKFHISPNGRIDNTNPHIRLSIAWRLLTAFRGDPDINQTELKQLYLDYVDPRYTKKLLKTDEQKRQEAQYSQALAQQAQARETGDEAKVKTLESQLKIMEQESKTALEIQKEIILSNLYGAEDKKARENQ